MSDSIQEFIKPIIIGCVGAVIGSVLAQKKDHKHWLRAQRSNAYADLLAAMRRIQRAFGQTALQDEIDSLAIACERVILIGSVETANLAEHVQRRIDEWTDENRKVHLPETTEEFVRFLRCREALIRSGRAELGSRLSSWRMKQPSAIAEAMLGVAPNAWSPSKKEEAAALAQSLKGIQAMLDRERASDAQDPRCSDGEDRTRVRSAECGDHLPAEND